jgi:hypothetical protein
MTFAETMSRDAPQRLKFEGTERRREGPRQSNWALIFAARSPARLDARGVRCKSSEQSRIASAIFTRELGEYMTPRDVQKPRNWEDLARGTCAASFLHPTPTIIDIAQAGLLPSTTLLASHIRYT